MTVGEERASGERELLDLVLSGGGVLGIGHVGAVSVLAEHFSFKRIAGTSAGSIVGALLAAGMPPSQLHKLIGRVDYEDFGNPMDWVRRFEFFGRQTPPCDLQWLISAVGRPLRHPDRRLFARRSR